MNKLFFLFVFILSSFSNTFCTSSLGKRCKIKSFNGAIVRDERGFYRLPFPSAQAMKSNAENSFDFTQLHQALIEAEQPNKKEKFNFDELHQALMEQARQAQAAAAVEQAQQDLHLQNLGAVQVADGNNNPWAGKKCPSQKAQYRAGQEARKAIQRANVAALQAQGRFPAPRFLNFN